jgi:hypothetical protein
MFVARLNAGNGTVVPTTRSRWVCGRGFLPALVRRPIAHMHLPHILSARSRGSHTPQSESLAGVPSYRQVDAKCSKDPGSVRSSNAQSNGYDEFCGHGDPCACVHGMMPVKSSKTVPWNGRTYDEFYCCDAECSDDWCTSPNGVGGTDCIANAERGEAYGCSTGTFVRNTPHFKPAVNIFGVPFYKYTCCRWPMGPNGDRQEPTELPTEEPNIGAIVGIVIAVIAVLSFCIGGIVACVCCCKNNSNATQSARMQPMSTTMMSTVQVVPPVATAQPVQYPMAPTAPGSCPLCGAPREGNFCSQCGKQLPSEAFEAPPPTYHSQM